MKIYLFFFIFIISSLNAQVLFRAADSLQREEIHNSMIAFYTEELMQAGLFESEKAARAAAITEIDQEQLDQDHCIFYYQLSSEDDRIEYGYLVYSIKDQTAYLEAIYLEKKHHGKGFGKQILHYFETLLLEKDIHVIKLYVFDHNKRAIGLYNKIGYEIETTYYINDKPIGHHMRKVI